MTTDDSVQAAIAASNEFRAFYAELVAFVRDGSREGEMRVSASRLAMRRAGMDGIRRS